MNGKIIQKGTGYCVGEIKGDWIIIELGDGQVAGSPESFKVEQFYQGLKINS